ncbi:MAG: hypothetical protein HQK77_22280 [Desulfobacterales bacterium]|nr:hypothetical protein [Desulfobacterales bacterium]
MDSSDNIYLTGYSSTSWGNPINPYSGEHPDVFVAKFSNTSLTEYLTLSKSVNPSESGTISVSPNKESYNMDETITVTASANPCYTFIGWSGDVSGTNPTFTLTMNGNKLVRANFILKPFTLKVIAENGTVTQSPNTSTYDCNSKVTLTPVPNTGYRFVQWGGDASGTTNPLIVTMNADKNISAIFEPEDETPPIQPSGIGKAIIIAGGGAHESNKALFQITDELCKSVYKYFSHRGFTDHDIYYLNPVSFQDVTGDGRDDHIVDGQLFEPEKEIEQAFMFAKNNLGTGQQFIFYFHGHASQDSLTLTQGRYLTAQKLKELMALLPEEIQKLIWIDACFSGSFLDDLAGKNRIIITSSEADKRSWNTEKGVNFTEKMIEYFRKGFSAYDVFKYTDEWMVNYKTFFRDQRPQFDDNGDGIYSMTGDGMLASRFKIGNDEVSAADPPAIVTVHPRMNLERNKNSAVLWVKTASGETPIRKVKGTVIFPTYSIPEYDPNLETLLDNLAREDIELIYNPAQDQWEKKYDKFNESGLYQLIYQAESEDGTLSDALLSEVESQGGEIASVYVGLNKSVYTYNERFNLSLLLNGQTMVDIYVALVFPEGYFLTFAYPFQSSWPGQIIPYKQDVTLTGEQTLTILNIDLPTGIPLGTYTCLGLVAHAGFDIMKPESWIHYDSKSFEIK